MKILVVNDDPIILKEIVEFLSFQKADILTANNRQNAIDIVEKNNIDVILADIKMPVMDGIGLLKYISDNHSHIYFLLMTGHENIDSAVAAVKYGAYDFLKKPFKLRELSVRLENINNELQLKKDLNEQKDYLIQTRLLASLGTLTAGIMHEINNSNTFIMGNAKFLINKIMPLFESEVIQKELQERSGISSKDLLKIFEDIHHGSERIVTIVKQATYFYHSRGSKKM